MSFRNWKFSRWWSPDGLRADQAALLEILSTAHQQRLAPGPLVAALACDLSWPSSGRLYLLSRRLHAGIQTIDALEQTPDALSDDEILALRFGVQGGTLSEVYGSLLQQHRAVQVYPRCNWIQPLVYFVVLVLVLGMIVSLLSAAIVPTLVEMATEFGVRRGVGVNRFVNVVTSISIAVPILIGGFISGIILFVFRRPLLRILRRTLNSRVSRSVAQSRAAQLLRLLAVNEQAGRPMGGSLSTIARYHYDDNIRQRLLYARNEVEQGACEWGSLAAAGLISTADATSLGQAGGGKARIWLLSRIATWKEARVVRRRQLWFAVLRHVGVLIGGLVVLAVSYAFINFLASLTSSLA